MDRPEISGNSIVIPSDSIYISAVDDFVYDRFGKAGISRSQIADFAISISEMVNNAITHGNSSRPEKKVTVKIDIDREIARISIKDQGTGFDPDSVPNPVDKENLLKQVGRGIFIVRSLMDSVDFYCTGSGTEVILQKKLKD